MRQLTDGSGDGRRKKNKSGEDGSYRTAQVSHGDGRRKKARLKKMVATTQLRLVPETENERRARLEYLSDNPIYIPNNLYLILIVALLEQFIIMHVCTMYVYKYNLICIYCV